MDVSSPIVVVYEEGVVEVGLEVYFGCNSGKVEGVRVMRRRRGGSGGGGFWVSSHL